MHLKTASLISHQDGVAFNDPAFNDPALMTMYGSGKAN